MEQEHTGILAVGIVLASILIFAVFSQSIFAKQEQVIIQNGIPENSDVFNNNVCTYNIIQVSNGGGVNPSTIEAVNCKTGIVVSSSTNASAVFNAVMILVNTNHGGDVHITGYSSQICCGGAYNITTAIFLPKNGHLHLYGDSQEHVTLKVPSCGNNDIFDFTYQSGLTDNSYFNYFNDFELWGNRNCGAGSTTSSGFVFNSTTYGLTDSVFEQIFFRDFQQDDFYMNTYSSWNNQFTHVTFEHAGRYCLFHTSGSDTRVLDSKFLFCHGAWAVVLQGFFNTFSSNWIYKADKSGVLLGAGTSGDVITSNRFEDNGQSATNTYYDIEMQNNNNNVLTGNAFIGSDTSNKIKYAISMTTSTSVNDTIVANTMQSNSGIGTIFINVPINSVSGTYGNTITNNGGYNPVNKVINFVDGSNWTPFGTTGTITNGTTYTIWNSPIEFYVSGGTGVSITLFDNKGNTIYITPLSGLPMPALVPVGYKVRIIYSTIPTISVYFH